MKDDTIISSSNDDRHDEGKCCHILKAYFTTPCLRSTPSSHLQRLPHVRHRRRGQPPQHRSHPDRGPQAAGIPRLRFLRRGRASGRPTEAGAQHRARGPARSQRGGGRPGRRHRHRPHPLGHAWRAGGAQRAPALLQQPHRAGAQRHHRKPRRAARRAAGPRLRLQQPDRHRGHRPPGGPPLRRRPVRRSAARHAAPEGRLCDCRVLPRRAAARGGRARRLAADPGHRQGRELPRQRRHGAGRCDRPDRLSGRGRRGRPATGQDLDRRAPGRRPLQERAARSAHGGGAQRRGRTGPVPALHAEGNLRAAARHRRHAGRRARHHARALRRRRLQGLQGSRSGADPGLRHQLLLWQHRQVLAGVDRRHPDQRGDRQRIPLPRQRAQPAHAGRDHHAKRRDRRHAGGAETCARPGHGAHADDLQRGHQRHGARMRLRLHHPRRAWRWAWPRPRPSPPSWWACSC